MKIIKRTGQNLENPHKCRMLLFCSIQNVCEKKIYFDLEKNPTALTFEIHYRVGYCIPIPHFYLVLHGPHAEKALQCIDHSINYSGMRSPEYPIDTTF